ncbi:MAG: hypothetical protein JXO48_02990 [Deltaproteobacteria bacterium]|nr:hypothetical protein [Deltaproteobacteria bacterium]
MSREKERQRRWREKKKAEGKKSITVMVSGRALEILNAEKEASQATTTAVIEKALLNLAKKPVIPVTRNEPVQDAGSTPHKKPLIDDEFLSRGELSGGYGSIIMQEGGPPRQGFLPRLFKSRKKMYGSKTKL